MPVEKDVKNGSLVLQYFPITAAWASEKELALQQLEAGLRAPTASLMLSYGACRKLTSCRNGCEATPKLFASRRPGFSKAEIGGEPNAQLRTFASKGPNSKSSDPSAVRALTLIRRVLPPMSRLPSSLHSRQVRRTPKAFAKSAENRTIPLGFFIFTTGSRPIAVCPCQN